MSRFTLRGRLAPAPVELLADDDATDRRSFLRATTGVAAAAAVPVALLAGSDDADATAGRPANGVSIPNPTTPEPDSPVMAYVHDAKAGTVVIMSGTTQRTVKDRELVRRLTVATKKKKAKRHTKRRPARRPTTSKKG